jgi:hypothetical protein
MKIIYAENPLNSVVELKPYEVEILRLKIKEERLEDLLIEAHLFLKEGSMFDLERARHAVNLEKYSGNKYNSSPLDKRVDIYLEEYLEALSTRHVGDCTCFASTCNKCQAECLLGIDTIEGLGKHEAHHLWCAFGESPENDWKGMRTIDEAIDYLKNYEPKADWEGWEAHVSRWLSEARGAYKWLTKYKKKRYNTVEEINRYIN